MKKSIFIVSIIFLFLLTNVSFSGEKEESAKAPKVEIAQWLQGEVKAAKGKNFYEGKTLVLEFWATWCGPCRRIIPHMNELVDQFKSDSVIFLSLSDEKKEVVEPFLAKNKMKASIALDNQDKTFSAYGVSSIPNMFVIDKKGNVVWGGHPAMFSKEMLEVYLKTGAFPESKE
ncbi:MAG: TlpA family protein disulfide reductase [Ignavibacteriales bacterium]|nr:TlpA family protein disulfide reductase [Ignavibacteriales bacterium]